MPSNSLSITDNRTGKSYELPIENETIRATDLRQMKEAPDDFGLMTYDPAYMNTASCKSTITFIDGDIGILEYRGYPIDELAENCTFPEVAYLVLNGELPNAAQLAAWNKELAAETSLARRRHQDHCGVSAHGAPHGHVYFGYGRAGRAASGVEEYWRPRQSAFADRSRAGAGATGGRGDLPPSCRQGAQRCRTRR